MKYHFIISLLNKLGYNILAVNFDSDIKYYVVYKWEPNYNSTVESKEFCRFQGVDITDFVSINQHLNVTIDSVGSTFDAKFSKMDPISCEFHKDFKWIYWNV